MNVCYRDRAETIADLMDDLREEGCPEDELVETAMLMLSEQESDVEPSILDNNEDNPFWEPPFQHPIELELEEMEALYRKCL